MQGRRNQWDGWARTGFRFPLCTSVDQWYLAEEVDCSLMTSGRFEISAILGQRTLGRPKEAKQKGAMGQRK